MWFGAKSLKKRMSVQSRAITNGASGDVATAGYQAVPGVADVDAVVGAKAPVAIDRVLGRGAAEGLAADGGKGDSAEAPGGGQVGKGLGLAAVQLGAASEHGGAGFGVRMPVPPRCGVKVD